MSYDINEFMNTYSKQEMEFAESFKEAFMISKTPSSLDKQGYDFSLSFFVDVKAQKKTNRYDKFSDASINWLELRKENGSAGWVFGTKKVIVFESGDEWIWVTPKKLQKFIREYGISEKTNNRDDFYKLYTRYGKINEVIMKVKTNDLRNFAFKISKKFVKLSLDDFFTDM